MSHPARQGSTQRSVFASGCLQSSPQQVHTAHWKQSVRFRSEVKHIHTKHSIHSELITIHCILAAM